MTAINNMQLRDSELCLNQKTHAQLAVIAFQEFANTEIQPKDESDWEIGGLLYLLDAVNQAIDCGCLVRVTHSGEEVWAFNVAGQRDDPEWFLYRTVWDIE